MRESLRSARSVAAVAGAIVVLMAGGAAQAQNHTSRPFMGPKATPGRSRIRCRRAATC